MLFTLSSHYSQEKNVIKSKFIYLADAVIIDNYASIVKVVSRCSDEGKSIFVQRILQAMISRLDELYPIQYRADTNAIQDKPLHRKWFYKGNSTEHREFLLLGGNLETRNSLHFYCIYCGIYSIETSKSVFKNGLSFDKTPTKRVSQYIEKHETSRCHINAAPISKSTKAEPIYELAIARNRSVVEKIAQAVLYVATSGTTAFHFYYV